MKSFVKRKICVRILDNKGRPVEKQGPWEGLRCSCSIVSDAVQNQTTCDLTIWGLSMDQMHEWSTLVPDNRQIEISVQTNDVDDGSMSVIYLGGIKLASVSVNAAPSAKPDEKLNTTKLDGEPNMGLYIHSTSTADKQTVLQESISCEGKRDAVKILETIAKTAGWEFENPDHISIMLYDRTYNGSPQDPVT